MSYMTKDQLENYLNGLPSNNNNNKEKSKSEYSQIKSELVYPMQQMSLQQQQQKQQEEEEVSYGTIQERMNRLRNATGTVLNATNTMTPAFPETPKPMIPTKPSFSSSSELPDAFEASLNRRLQAQQRRQQQPQQQSPKKPLTPPLPPPLKQQQQQQDTPSTPPPAVPNSPRPPKPNNNNMVRTLNPIYAGLDCPACHKTIDGSVVSAMDQIWHAHCFKCIICQKPLENEKYYEKNDKLYCGKDYRTLFSLYCDFCHEPIENSAISALGKHYHEGHFCCTVCREPFGDHSAFMVHEDKPYCQEDYLKVCGKKCSGCGQYITGEYINALDQEWHKSCFNCTDCKRPFTNGTFLVRDNKPYCEEHYHHLRQQYQQPAQQRPHQAQQKRPQQSSQQRPQLPQQQRSQQSQKRKPPTIKPKPVSTKKPEFPPKSELEIKRPDINSYSSSSSSIKTDSNKNITTTSTGGSKMCHQCHSAIDGPCASALGHDYHIHHFQCSMCSRALSSRVPGMWQGDDSGELVCKMCAFKKSQQ